MYSETRQPHASTCECDHCIADSRYEEQKRWRDEAHQLHQQAIEMGRENNRLLSSILDELRALRSSIKDQSARTF